MRIAFSRTELRDLAKAWLLSSLAFAIALKGLSMNLLYAIPLALLTAGIGIILHELMHKFTAARFGIHSEFRSFDFMLVVSVAISVFGFIFLAPGAVFMDARFLDRRKNGIISLAGPLTNIVLALLCVPLMLLPIPVLGLVAAYGFMINSWLGFFNLLPFWNLDGTKVMMWKPLVFWPMIMLAALMAFSGYFFG